jgi:hypothetical protein
MLTGMRVALFSFIAALSLAAPALPAYAENENALVAKYCGVCHDDAHRNGGLSLQHFDIEKVEPSLAAMMVSKLKSGAFGAAGLPLPDLETEDGLFNALVVKSAGATDWHASRSGDSVTVSILRPVAGTDELYRLKVTCRPGTGESEMQLAWAPTPAKGDRRISVAADGTAAVMFNVEGREKMGNGAKKKDGTDSTSTPAAVALKMLLPDRTLIVSEVFPDEVVVFPFDRLPAAMRQELSSCFQKSTRE